MYTQLENPKENKLRAATNSVFQKKSNVKQDFAFVDNRHQTIQSRKLQDMADKHTKNNSQFADDRLISTAQKSFFDSDGTKKKNEVKTRNTTIQRILNKTFENLPAANPAVNYDPDGTPHAPFEMEADWTSTLADVNNERYRWNFIQEVRGQFTTQNGANAPVVNPHPLTPGNTLHAANWQVDGDANGAYGPTGPNVNGNAWHWNNQVLEFRAHDDPGHDPPVHNDEIRRTDLNFRAKFQTINTVGTVVDDPAWTTWDVVAESSKDAQGRVNHA